MGTRYAAYRALLGFACQAPVFALFALEHGAGVRDLTHFALAFAAAKLLFDVPSGLLADRIGRRPAILLRIALELASVAVLFEHRFLLSACLAGAGCAFSSGAEAALVFERHPQDFARVFGRAGSWGAVSTALAALAGGALATVHFDLVYVLRLAVLLAAGGVALGFPAGGAPAGPARRFRLPAALARGLAFAGLVGAVQVAALQLQQPYLSQSGVPLAAFGLLYVGFQLAAALGSRLAHRLPRAFPAISGLSVAGFSLMAVFPGPAGILGILLLKFAHGISLPAFGRALNERAPAGARATALSLRSLFEGAALLVAAPALGGAAAGASLPAAFGVAALLVIPSFFLMETPCPDSAGSPLRA